MADLLESFVDALAHVDPDRHADLLVLLAAAAGPLVRGAADHLDVRRLTPGDGAGRLAAALVGLVEEDAS